MCLAGGILQNSGVDEFKTICCILDHASQVQYMDLLAFLILWSRGKWLKHNITKVWSDLDILTGTILIFVPQKNLCGSC